MCGGRARAIAVALVAASCVACAATARAQSPTVLLREQPCEPARYDPAALRPLLQLELKALGLQLASWPDGDEQAQAAAVGDALVLATLRCTDTGDAVELELADTATQTRTKRTLALSDVPQEARARALALAIGASLEQSLSAALPDAATAEEESALPPAVAGALRARLLRRLAAPQPAPAAEPAAAPAAAPTPAPAPGGVELAAVTRVFPSYSTGMLGLAGGLRFTLGSSTSLAVELEAIAGQSELSDAEGTVGKMWLYAASAGLGLSVRSRSAPELALGPVLRIGYTLAHAQVERDGATAHDDHGALLMLLLAATLRAPIGRDASLLASVDLGYAPLGIVFTGDQARLSGLAGITTALRLGCAL